MIIIINYGIGNLTSVQNMLKKSGATNVLISNREDDIIHADKLILPGVGHFDYGMNQLKESGLVPILEKKVHQQKVPILGICLGAQLMTKSSDEGSVSGLGWVDAETLSFNKSLMPEGFKIPHMGWNYVKVENENPLSKGIADDSRFYFVHSYHMKMNNSNDSWLVSNYGYDFCAAFRKDNIYACQFHPEKSHSHGLNLMKNFVNL
jgi:glutamine amidotransferase